MSERGPLGRTIAITREVSPAIADCELTHLERVPIDLRVARAEHAAYERALEDAGCEVRRLPSDADQPDAVFVEDAAVVLDEVAVITRPGAESRRAETAVVAGALAALRPVVELRAPATLDGGDVLRIGRRLLVGIGGRTNAEGVEQLRALAAPLGYEVRALPVRGCLHLKTAATLAAHDLVLYNPEWADAEWFDGLRLLAVHPDEPFAANVLLANGRAIHGAHFPRTRERLESAGVHVVPVPAGELAKAEGAVTCCSVLVEGTGTRE